MSRFTDRLERDLKQIADHASPSTTNAWESIRSRIGEQDDQPEMEIIMLSPDLDEAGTSTRRIWVWAASAAAAVLVLLGGFLVVDRSDEDGVATELDSTVPSEDDSEGDAESLGVESEAIATAERFMEAFVNLEPDTAVDLIVDEPTEVTVESATDRESVGRLIAAYEAVDTEFEAKGCEFAEPNLVTCGVSWRNAWFDAGDFPPVEGTFNLAIDGEKIAGVEYGFDAQNLDEPYNQFLTWMLDNHPDEAEGLWLEQDGTMQGPTLTDDAILILESRTADYVAARNEEATAALRGSWRLSLGPRWEFLDRTIVVTNGAVDNFTYTATSTTIVLMDVSCGVEFPGTYEWDITDDVLTLTKVTDGCGGRADNLDGVTAERVN